MNLDIGGWRCVQEPSEGQIREAIRELDDFEGFLVLSRGDGEFIQSSGDSRAGFNLEYREGARDRHFRAKKFDFDAETIIAKFAAYARGDDGWKDDVDWEKFTL